MANLTQETLEEAKKQFELGVSLTQIAKNLKISKSNLSVLARKRSWNKNSKAIIVKEVAENIRDEIAGAKTPRIDCDSVPTNPSGERVTISLRAEAIAEVTKRVKDEIGKAHFIEVVASDILLKAYELLRRGTTRKTIKVSNGVAVGESLQVVEDELTTTELKQLADIIDKLSLTLNVNPRFAPQAIQNFSADSIKVIAPFKDKENDS